MPFWVTLTTAPPLGELKPASHLSPTPSTQVTLPAPPCLSECAAEQLCVGREPGTLGSPDPGSKQLLAPAALTPTVRLGPLVQGCGDERLNVGTRQTCTNGDPSGTMMGTPRTAPHAQPRGCVGGFYLKKVPGGPHFEVGARRRGRKGRCEGAS